MGIKIYKYYVCIQLAIHYSISKGYYRPVDEPLACPFVRPLVYHKT